MEVFKGLMAAVGIILGTLVVLFICMIPNFTFQYLGWAENPDMDLLSRLIGFIMFLLGLQWYISHKSKD